MDERNRVWKEGVTAGLIGAGGVAFWFLIVDLLAGSAFATPELLGRTMMSLFGDSIDLSPTTNVVAYTVVHVAAFVLVGVIASRIVAASERVPGILAGALLFFVVFETAFYGLTLFLAEGTVLGGFAWYQVGGANLFAAVLMGGYMFRAHPELLARLEGALSARS